MKKFILSSVFVFLMMFSPASDAHAQEFCALGTFSAGEEINAYITMVSSDAAVEPLGLPLGLRLKETPDPNGKHLSLVGSSAAAGDLSFTIAVSDSNELIFCTAYFEPALPRISVSRDVSCAVNDRAELSVRATVTDGGTVSYQWYEGAGFASLPMEGQNGSSLFPDTSLPGQYCYYCRVTNNNNGQSSSADSDIMFVTVSSPSISSIDIETLPAKLLYAPGDRPDTQGLRLRVNYDNGSSTVIDNGFELNSPFQFQRSGKELVEIYYEGFSCYYEVEVSPSAAQIEGIGVLTMPEKTVYNSGEAINTKGLVIRAYTSDGQFDIDSGFEVYPQTLSTEGRQSVTVSYKGKSCSFTVLVNDSNTIDSIAIASLPTKRDYTVGDSVDLSGLSLQLIYGGRTELVNQGFDWSPRSLTKAGTQEITVTYGQHSVKFSINVTESSQSPKPSDSAKPEQSTNSQSPAPSESPVRVKLDHQARDVNALVKIIFAVAIISLAALAAYIFYMQKRGKR